jgi:hypothetical protein
MLKISMIFKSHVSTSGGEEKCATVTGNIGTSTVKPHHQTTVTVFLLSVVIIPSNQAQGGQNNYI